MPRRLKCMLVLNIGYLAWMGMDQLMVGPCPATESTKCATCRPSWLTPWSIGRTGWPVLPHPIVGLIRRWAGPPSLGSASVQLPYRIILFIFSRAHHGKAIAFAGDSEGVAALLRPKASYLQKLPLTNTVEGAFGRRGGCQSGDGGLRFSSRDWLSTVRHQSCK